MVRQYINDTVELSADASKNKFDYKYGGHTRFANDFQSYLQQKMASEKKEWFVASSDKLAKTRIIGDMVKVPIKYHYQPGSALIYSKPESNGPNWYHNKHWDIFVSWCKKKEGKLNKVDMAQHMLNQAEIEIRSLDTKCSNVRSIESVHEFLSTNMSMYAIATAKVIKSETIVFPNNKVKKSVEGTAFFYELTPFGFSKDINCGRWFEFCKRKIESYNVLTAKVFLAFNPD